jgi:hypothetical protein
MAEIGQRRGDRHTEISCPDASQLASSFTRWRQAARRSTWIPPYATRARKAPRGRAYVDGMLILGLS